MESSIPDISDLMISNKSLKKPKQKFRLKGKGEFIDNFGRLKVNYNNLVDSKAKLERLAKSMEGDCPLRRDGYMIHIKKAKFFLPTLTTDKNLLLGKNITMLVDVNPYRYERDNTLYEGWYISTNRIEYD